MPKRIRSQIKVPSIPQLQAQTSADFETRCNYIDNMQIYFYGTADIKILETRIVGIKASQFKEHLLKVIECRKRQLKQNPFKWSLAREIQKIQSLSKHINNFMDDSEPKNYQPNKQEQSSHCSNFSWLAQCIHKSFRMPNFMGQREDRKKQKPLNQTSKAQEEQQLLLLRQPEHASQALDSVAARAAARLKSE